MCNKCFPFIHVVQYAHNRAGKRPLYKILSVTHGFIYSLINTVYTPAFSSLSTLLKKGPFIEGSFY